MKKMQDQELKTIMAGASAARVECVMAFMDQGYSLEDADNICRSIGLWP